MQKHTIIPITLVFVVFLMGTLLVGALIKGPPLPRACTQEAMLCPDGKTYVSRTGPQCGFAKCPSISNDEEIIFSDEARKLCGPEPPAICSPGMQLGCRIEDKRWDCYPMSEKPDTSDWKTYRNEKYGFEVSYPSDWTLEIGKNLQHKESNPKAAVEFMLYDSQKEPSLCRGAECSVREPDGIEIQAFPIAQKESVEKNFEDEVARWRGTPVFMEKKIKIGDIREAVLYRFGTLVGPYQSLYFSIPEVNLFFVVTTWNYPVENVLSTFKFITQTLTSVTPAPQDKKTFCRVDSDCTVLLCTGAVNKEWVKTVPPEPPCAIYVGYTAICKEQKCTAVKK